MVRRLSVVSAVTRGVDTSVRCYACPGRFAFAIENDRPVARHSVPYCPAFEAISSTIDALRFAEACEMKVEPL